MQELLQQIESGFKVEKDSHLNSVKERTTTLVSYEKLLSSAIEKAHELGKVYATEVQAALNSKVSEERKRDESISTHNENVKKHNEWVAHSADIKDRMTKEYDNLCEKKDKIDKIMTGLMVEYRSVEDQITQARANALAGERRVTELKTEESKLISSLEAKKIELSDITNKVENERKQFSLISSNIANLK